jgi:hypothetical protein
MALTKAQKRVKEILLANPGLTAGEFARKMWADSPNWKKVFNCGNGATRGSGMIMLGGSYLRKLCKKGMVNHYLDWSNRDNKYVGNTKYEWNKYYKEK